ncbi:phospholipase D-like domain-containing protein [Cupriavidus basilensis]
MDLQYYIIEPDESSREILHQVRAAAERGVRVSWSVDDLRRRWRGPGLSALRADIANIEVRMFNPFPAGRFSKFTRMLSSATDVRRLNRRMHNKAFIADNALAMTGGRNIGNAYFLRAPDTNFVDLDVHRGRACRAPALRCL